MVKASLLVLIWALCSVKIPLEVASVGLLAFPVAAVVYMFFHHGYVVDLYGGEVILLYLIELVGYGAAAIFVFETDLPGRHGGN